MSRVKHGFHIGALLCAWITGMLVVTGIHAQSFDRNWSRLDYRADKLAEMKELNDLRTAFINDVTQRIYDPENPVITRAYNWDDLARPRHIRHPATMELQGEEAVALALALDDVYLAQQLSLELRDLALAYRLTNRDDILKRLRRQLQEIVTWNPLQRSGWSLISKTSYTLPFASSQVLLEEQSNIWRTDGCWYATTLLLRALNQVNELIDEDDIGEALTLNLERLVALTFDSLINDYQRGRIYAANTDAKDSDLTADWLLYHEARIHCILLLVKEATDATSFDTEVDALKTSLLALGRKGEWPEGAYRALLALPSLLESGRLLSQKGNRRLEFSQYRGSAANWLMLNCLPGKQFLNTPENPGLHPQPRKNTDLATLMASIFAETGSQDASWAFANFFTTDAVTPEYLMATSRVALDGGSNQEPYQKNLHANLAQRLFWRDGWLDSSSAVTLLGGVPDKADREADRGHIGFIHRGNPILIEAGTPPQAEPLGIFLKRDAGFSSANWHNVLRVGKEEPLAGSASIRTGPVLPERGTAVIYPGDCYPTLNAWTRDVSWNMPTLRVVDTVVTSEGKRHPMTFYWHLGANKPVELKELSPEVHEARWHDAELRIESSVPVTITQTIVPDYSLLEKAGQTEPTTHVMLEVRTRMPLLRCKITTIIKGL